MFFRLKRPFFLCAILALYATPVFAESVSWEDLKSQVGSLIQAGNKDQALAALLANENQLSGQPDFDYALGVMALDLGQAGFAQSALERVVLMNPNHAGAWMDLAIASYQLGEFERAQQIITHIEQNFNPTAALKLQLSQVKRKISYQPLVQGWRGAVSLSYGYDSNVNSGLSDGSFYLSLGAGVPVMVEVADSQLPIADQAQQMRGNLHRFFQHENGAETMVAAGLMLKEYQNQGDYDYVDGALAINYRRPFFSDKDWLINLGANARYIYFGGKPLGHFLTASSGVSKKLGQCEMGGRLDLEQRTYQANNYFDSTLPWLALTYGCQTEQMLYGFGLRTGKDMVSGPRPGGDTSKVEGNAFVRGQLAGGLSYSALVYAAEYRDDKGYSAIINNNAKRKIHRLGQRLELQYALPRIGPNWSAQLELENSKDHSNLPIARIDGQQVWLGLRYQLF
jgi:tetratricopeptide (TPR) repeat protein